MDKKKLKSVLGIGVQAAMHLKKDKRFDNVEPLVPVVDGAPAGEPRFITITAVGTKGNEVYVLVFTKEMAKETADRFYDFIKRIEDEEKAE